MPALDVQLWVEGVRVKYQNFRKSTANNMVLMKSSAQPDKTKRTSLTQEGIRILRNTSLELPWHVAAGHLSRLSSQMRGSGYEEQFRLEVIHCESGDSKLVPAH